MIKLVNLVLKTLHKTYCPYTGIIMKIFFFMQAQYKFCHEALADFLDGFETYANFKQPQVN